ncbi:hypothetical protein [Streptosporangium sp. NPDC049644]|uniref:hypothetical protein n=1 Tax=Streptosporangium sp. NPDC049644 TaxID=3155507 RepID=UPI00341AAFA6
MTLTQQVACTDVTIDPDLLDRIRHELLAVPADDWVVGYGQYQSGGWGTLSLLNATGRAADVTISSGIRWPAGTGPRRGSRTAHRLRSCAGTAKGQAG